MILDHSQQANIAAGRYSSASCTPYTNLSPNIANGVALKSKLDSFYLPAEASTYASDPRHYHLRQFYGPTSSWSPPSHFDYETPVCTATHQHVGNHIKTIYDFYAGPVDYDEPPSGSMTLLPNQLPQCAPVPQTSSAVTAISSATSASTNRETSPSAVPANEQHPTAVTLANTPLIGHSPPAFHHLSPDCSPVREPASCQLQSNVGTVSAAGGLMVAPLKASTTAPRRTHNYTLYSSAPRTGKTRTADKYRQVYTDFQRLELEKEYCANKYINQKRKTEISRATNLTDRQIKIWFQNRRAKERRIRRRSRESGKAYLNESIVTI